MGTASIRFIEPLSLQGFLFICVHEVFSTPLPSFRGDVLIYQKTHDALVSLLCKRLNLEPNIDIDSLVFPLCLFSKKKRMSVPCKTFISRDCVK